MRIRYEDTCATSDGVIEIYVMVVDEHTRPGIVVMHDGNVLTLSEKEWHTLSHRITEMLCVAQKGLKVHS